MSVTESSESTETPDVRTTPPGRSTGWAALRPLVLRLHFYAGVLIAPFLLVAAGSGLLYAASYQLERLVYADELRVPVGDGVELPLSQQVENARDAYPEGSISAIRLSPGAGETTRVLLAGVPDVDDDKTLAVFVDPYTGEVRGALEQYGSTGALPLRTWIDELHRDLHLGEVGRLYSELAASWLWVVAGGGLLLFLARWRARRARGAGAAEKRPATGRRRTLGLHGTLGATVAAGLFFLAATGLTWSAYAGANVTELRSSLGQSTPDVSPTIEGAAETTPGHEGHPDVSGEAGGGDRPASGLWVDEALAIARAQGIDNPVELVPPADAESAYVIREVQRAWPTKQDAVAINPNGGEVLDVVRFDDYPLLAKLSRWGIDLHMGTLFGLVNQIALGTLALCLITMILLGYRMWWQRGRGGAFGRPLPRGAWRRVPPALLWPLVACVALVGWFLPLFGVTLLGFLLVDTVLGRVEGAPARFGEGR
ncbi:PepSY-associated TM helix domain-containing protein [Streptomyces hainanensis]|uniref:PepSY domain-containing protein n=1 Tax=Streptomyces hainanensis TaxID=402648 RepID=A0A4V2Y2E5_9ACTN|nr:PepSY domain-containing protein [Streptomyces hainanensis]TDC72295.1 PepSY domain-containing protein [Streptomyces hainanensis]